MINSVLVTKCVAECTHSDTFNSILNETNVLMKSFTRKNKVKKNLSQNLEKGFDGWLLGMFWGLVLKGSVWFHSVLTPDKISTLTLTKCSPSKTSLETKMVNAIHQISCDAPYPFSLVQFFFPPSTQ